MKIGGVDVRAFFKAWMLNMDASSPRSKPNKVVEALKLSRGQRIADVGAGGGFFTFKFAVAVRESGRVFAVDTDKGLLELIRRRAARMGLTNIELIHASKEGLLSERRIDLVFMRNVYHHRENRMEYARRLSRALKPDGKIVVIEYRREDTRYSTQASKRFVPREEIMREMGEAGYRKHEGHGFLPEQSFLVFTPPTASKYTQC